MLDGLKPVPLADSFNPSAVSVNECSVDLGVSDDRNGGPELKHFPQCRTDSRQGVATVLGSGGHEGGLPAPNMSGIAPPPTHQGEEQQRIRHSFLKAQAQVIQDLRRTLVPELRYGDDSFPSTVAFYREYVASSTPCVIRGMARRWPALRRWSTASGFMQTIGADTEVTVALTPNGRADAVTRVPTARIRNWVDDPTDDEMATPGTGNRGLNESHCFQSDGTRAVEVFVAPAQVKMPVSSFFRQLISQRIRCGMPLPSDAAFEPGIELFKRPTADSEVVYAQCQNNCLFTEYEALLNDLGPEAYDFGAQLFGAPPDASNVWIGSAHSETTTHQDWYENMYAVITGTKVFYLIPPWEATLVKKRSYYSAEYVAEKSATGEDLGFAVAIDWRPEEKTPWIKFDPTANSAARANEDHGRVTSKATVLKVEVHAGDVLYLPAAWFHHVAQVNDHEGKVIAVNYWFDMQWGPTTALQGVLEKMDAATLISGSGRGFSMVGSADPAAASRTE